MTFRVLSLLLWILILGGCSSSPTKAVPLKVLNVGDEAIMWRLKIDGVQHILVGGFPVEGSDVKRITPFFLVPERLWNEIDFGVALLKDGSSMQVNIRRTAKGDVWTKSKLSEPRIFRLSDDKKSGRELNAISQPIPTGASRIEVLRILAASLGKVIEEERVTGRPQIGGWSPGPSD